METERYIFWGVSLQRPSLCVIKPFDGEPAMIGNGNMVARVADSRDKVDRRPAKTPALGGSYEGAPSDRGGGFYAGYFRDPEGTSSTRSAPPERPVRPASGSRAA
jgi:hypothetical protein